MVVCSSLSSDTKVNQMVKINNQVCKTSCPFLLFRTLSSMFQTLRLFLCFIWLVFISHLRLAFWCILLMCSNWRCKLEAAKNNKSQHSWSLRSVAPTVIYCSCSKYGHRSWSRIRTAFQAGLKDMLESKSWISKLSKDAGCMGVDPKFPRLHAAPQWSETENKFQTFLCGHWMGHSNALTSQEKEKENEIEGLTDTMSE